MRKKITVVILTVFISTKGLAESPNECAYKLSQFNAKSKVTKVMVNPKDGIPILVRPPYTKSNSVPESEHYGFIDAMRFCAVNANHLDFYISTEKEIIATKCQITNVIRFGVNCFPIKDKRSKPGIFKEVSK